MRLLPRTLSETSTLKIIRVRHTSWASTFARWQRYLRPWKIYVSKLLSFFSISFIAAQLSRLLRYQQFSAIASPVAPPQPRQCVESPKGEPQRWKLPISDADLNRFMNPGEVCRSREWKHEETGWTMLVISPPRGIGELGSKRWMMYLHGGGFLFPMCVSIPQAQQCS